MNVWEAAARLTEAAAGSIIRLLGMHKVWAEMFDREFGQLAFPVAKLVRMSYPDTCPVHDSPPWSAEPLAVWEGRPDPLDGQMDFFLDETFGYLGFKDVGEGIQLLKKSPALVKGINSIPLSLNDKDGMMSAVEELISQEAQKIHAKKPNPADIFIQLGGGWYWQNLRTSDCPPEAQMMGHCGTDDRGTLFSLRDPNGSPHVTVTYNEKKNTVYQIKGKQNKLPDRKYWPAIEAFFKKTDAHLSDSHVRQSELGQALSAYSKPGQLPKVVAQTDDGSKVWVEDKDTPDAWVLVPADGGVEEYAETPAENLEYVGYDAAWLQDGEIDYSFHGQADSDQLLRPLVRALRQQHPDLRIRGNSPLNEPEAFPGHVPGRGDPGGYRQEELALEHARMMGPVAYAEALARLEGVHEDLQLEFLTDIAPNKEEALQMLSDIVGENWDLLVDRGVDPEGVEYLGAGNNGAAWQLQDGRVLKVTTDDAEAHVASHLRGKKFKHVFTVYDVWAFPGTYNGHHVYGLVTEGGLIKPTAQEESELDDTLHALMNAYGDEDEHGYRPAAYDLLSGDMRKVLTNFMASHATPQVKRMVLQGVKKFQLNEIMADMKRIGFQADLHSGNVMKRPDGSWVLIDIGTGGNSENDKPPFLEDTEMSVLPVLGEDHLDQDVRLDEVGIQGPAQGTGPQMRGQNSGAWSGGMHVLADPQEHVPVDPEDEEARFLDQDRKTVGPGGSNSPF